jgi:ABC-2 type transport system ATP-binding protein
MIEVNNLVKRYGAKTAVDGVSFQVQPGRVTGFLGPNGAGKSTTMRMILGLDRPTSGTATIDGRPYASLPSPITSVGAMLDSRSMHPGRTARDHLAAVAATHRLGRRRVREVLETTGLSGVARRRIRTFSLGMGQRLGIATALLGDPAAVLLDEPVNGLDPDGVIWVRRLAREMAAEGRAVLISSHLMTEMEQTADHLVVLGAGRVLADAPIGEVIDASGARAVHVTADGLDRLEGALLRAGGGVVSLSPDTAEVTGLDAKRIADIAFTEGIVVSQLKPVERSLEQAFFALTGASVEYRASEHSTAVPASAARTSEGDVR